MLDRNYYHSLRGRYIPDHLKLVVIAESPPTSGILLTIRRALLQNLCSPHSCSGLELPVSPRKLVCASFTGGVA